MLRYLLGILILAEWAAPFVHAQPDDAAIRNSVAQVVVFDGETPTRLGSAFAVTAAGHVMTAAHLVADEEQIVVVPLASGAELVARVVGRDDRADVALLLVNGLELPVLKLAMDGFEPGRRVFSVGVWPETGPPQSVAQAAEEVALVLAGGSVGTHDEMPVADDSPPIPLIVHNAMIPATGYGGPLLNECGEVVGVNRGSPGVSTRRLRRGYAPKDVVYAVEVSAMSGLLEAAAVEVLRSTESCVEALAAARAEAEATQEQLEEVESEKEAADQRAAEARILVGELETRYEEAVRTGSERAEDLEARLEAAREEQETTRAVAGALESRVVALQQQLERQATDRTRLILMVVVVGALLAGLGVTAFAIHRRNARQLAAAQEDAAHARREANDIRADSAASSFPDFVLLGVNGDGVPVSLKLPRALLVGDGAIVGRSPRNSTLLIDDRTLSREHARIFGDGDAVYIEDLRSTNGTQVNGRRIAPDEPTLVEHGVTIELGEVKLQLTESA